MSDELKPCPFCSGEGVIYEYSTVETCPCSMRPAQPAEAEGVSNARLMNTLAELARRAPLRTLQTICETQHQVSTVKLERYLEPIGDTLAGYAFTLRIDFDKLSAALSALTAERDRLQKKWARVESERDGLLQKLAQAETRTMDLMTRHFAGSLSNREQDRKLDECLSEGIAMLEAERDQYRDMAGCMDLLRRDLIEAGIVGESCPPMFMTEGVLAHIAKLRAEVEASDWIPLTKATPPDGVPVLRWPGWAAELSIDEWCNDYGCFLMSIEGGERATHWKPLCAPKAAMAAKEA